MTNLVSNWLKLNKLLDQYQKEERDITAVIHYNIQLDSILIDTFTSSNNTAIHYAAVALPKLLCFPSAMVLFSSIEKSSIILHSILQSVFKCIENGKGISEEVEMCLREYVEYYSNLQINCPNIRRVCNVFCENLLGIALQFIDKSNPSIDCTSVKNILESALFHTSLSEDYINFFSKKLRKTEHIQKLFSALKKLGEAEDIRILTPFYNLLPELFTAFLNAYPDFQTNYKKFHLSAFTQFADSLKIHSRETPQIKVKIVCLARLLESIEIHFRAFPNDPDLISAQTETFTNLISKLIDLYPEYPLETSRCFIHIQNINHILIEEQLQLIFGTVFKTEIADDALINHILQIYCKLNQLDKLMGIVMVAIEGLENVSLNSITEFNIAIQLIFSTTSLSMCNKCIQLLLCRIENNNSLFILCETLSRVISVTPIGELNNTATQRDTYLTLMTRLNVLLQGYASSKLSTNTSSVVFLNYFTLLHSFISSLLILVNLPFSRDWVMSIEIIDLSHFETYIIPTNWTKKWNKILSNMDEHSLKRIQETQLNILLTLSRFTQPGCPSIPISPEKAIDLLSDRLTHTITGTSNPDIITPLLQYWQITLCKLSHEAKLKVSEYIIQYMTKNSMEHVLTTQFGQIIHSPGFKEIKVIHPYLAYNIMYQMLSRIVPNKDTSLSKIVIELRDFYLILMKQLDDNLIEDIATQIHESTCSLVQQVRNNFISREQFPGNLDDKEINTLISLLNIIPLYYLPIELKIRLLIGLQMLMLILGRNKEGAKRIIVHSTALLRGINDKIPRSDVQIKHIPAYLSTLELFAKYLYAIADVNKMDRDICYKLFEEISTFLLERIVEQFNSLTRHTTSIWEDMSRSKTGTQTIGLLLELTRSLIKRVISMWTEFRHKNNSTQGELLQSLNNLVEISTPILLRHLKQTNNFESLQLIATNLKYIFLTRKSATNPLIEEAIMKITGQVLEFIRADTVGDVTTLESVYSITDTLRQYSYTLDIVLEDKINTLMLPIQNVDWECWVSIQHVGNAKCSENIGHNRYLLTKNCVLGLIACSEVESTRVLLSGIVDKIDREYIKSCHLLGWMIEANIPDTHRSEIRKVFQKILHKITLYLTHTEINSETAFITLRLLTTIFKLPIQIGLSSRHFVASLTPLSLVSLDTFTHTSEFPQLFQAKSQCLYHSLHNYPDSTISCIPVFLLLTKELINLAFTLHNPASFTILKRLLEAYTTHKILSNYTYHLIQQYIISAQKWTQEQAIKKTIKSSIFSLIGFSKPETLLALQAQLDSTGRSYYAELKEEYEKFYRFKGKT